MEIDVKQFFRIIRRSWIFIFIIISVFTAAVGIYTYIFQKSIYEASTKVMVNKTRTINGESEINISDMETNLKIISTYKDLLKTDWMMKGIMAQYPEFNLTSKELIEMIKVSDSGSQVMTFSIRDQSYERAAKIVNAVTEQFHTKIPDLIEVKNITILNVADLADQPEPVSPNRLLNVIIALIFSTLMSIGVVMVREYYDDTIRSEEDIRSHLDLPILAVMSKMRRREYKVKKLKVMKKNDNKAGEQNYVATN